MAAKDLTWGLQEDEERVRRTPLRVFTEKVAWSCSFRATRPVQGSSSLEALLIRVFRCSHLLVANARPFQVYLLLRSGSGLHMASRGRVVLDPPPSRPSWHRVDRISEATATPAYTRGQ